MIKVPMTQFRLRPSQYLEALAEREMDILVLTKHGNPRFAIVPFSSYAHLIAEQNWQCPYCNKPVPDPRALIKGWRVMGSESQVAECPLCGNKILVHRVPSQIYTVTVAPEGAEDAST